MDATPIRLADELGCWSYQLREQIVRLREAEIRYSRLPLGGTAVGNGINCPAEFAPRVVALLGQHTGLPLSVCENRFSRMAAQDASLEISGALENLAVSLTKICNDLRWMNSGPNAGINEIRLPELQAGSSIMPGKVNPVIPEAVLMVAAQISGFHHANQLAAQSGSFQLNVMLPLMACNLLDGIGLLARSCHSLAVRVIAGFEVNRDHIELMLNRNPILVTALNARIGYQRAALIARRAFEERRPLLDIALEETDIPEVELRALLDPLSMAG
jgi:fumarate hydratase class II